MSAWSWLMSHKQAWLPGLLLVGVVVNGFFGRKRWPDVGQSMHLVACVFSLAGAAHIWSEAALEQTESQAAWGQVLGALAIVIVTIDSAWKVLKALTARDPKAQ